MSAPADTVDQVENVEPALEESVRAIFEAADIVALTRLNQPKEFQQATPRVEIESKLGGHTGRRDMCPDGIVRYSAWTVDIAVQAVTLLQSDEAGNALHTLFRSRIRQVCSSLAQSSWADHVRFPFHLIAEALRETAITTAKRDGFEYSTLNFRGIVMVRPGAWPLI